MSAAQLRLDNLTAIVDYNKLQSDGDSRQILDLGDLAGKFSVFGWNVCEIDGHDIPAVVAALEQKFDRAAPKVIVANTVKGKGISFMENNNEWHHNRLTKANYDLAMAELGPKSA
jgi:transketolase